MLLGTLVERLKLGNFWSSLASEYISFSGRDTGWIILIIVPGRDRRKDDLRVSYNVR